jgi:hypothetical protein
MPKGPNGEKRPADVIGNAIRIARIATGEEPEEAEQSPRSQAAKLGGRNRAETLSAERRSEIASTGAKARWHKEPTED